jgi:dihydrolipoamide dehydrogenase
MASDDKYDLIIIGTGPGGYMAAVHAAQLDLRVACVEKAPRLGGVCLNVGCIPSKALLDSSEYYHLAKNSFADHGIKTGKVSLDLATMMARKDEVVADLTKNVRQLLERNNIDIIEGKARLAGADRIEVSVDGKKAKQTYQSKSIILATGSEPVAASGIAFDGKAIVSSTEALEFKSVPKHLGIVGGGYIGLELGSVWLRLGAEVTVIEMLPKIATGLDGQVGRKLQQVLKRQGMKFRLNSKVTEAKKANKKIKVTIDSKGETESITFDRLLVSVGRRPLTQGLDLEEAGVEVDPDSGRILVDASYRTSVPSIFAIGDLIAGPMLAHKASAEGIAAVECIAGKPGEVNYDAVPSVIYTWPEVASVGLTEEQAKERDVPYKTGTYPFAGVGRARCLGETDGFVKLIAHGKSDRVLGIHMVGPRASEIIAEGVLAVQFDAKADDLARTVHAHPTFSEALMEAAMMARKGNA